MPWIGKSVISVRANSLSTDDSLSSLTTLTIQALRSNPARGLDGTMSITSVTERSAPATRRAGNQGNAAPWCSAIRADSVAPSKSSKRAGCPT